VIGPIFKAAGLLFKIGREKYEIAVLGEEEHKRREHKRAVDGCMSYIIFILVMFCFFWYLFNTYATAPS
jgi:heme/copper-type cytochrome/quinol oxidase subunit 3